MQTQTTMKNKLLIGILTFFTAIFTCILILNFSNTEFKKNNDFDRKFSNNVILKFDNKYDKLNRNSIFEFFYSNTSLVEGKFNNADNKTNQKEYCLYFSDYSFSNKNFKKLILHSSANVLLVDENYVIYSYKKELYQLNLKNDLTIKSKLKNVDISFIISLGESSNRYLFFGEVFENNAYETGFFILDMVNNKIVKSKMLQTNNNSYKPEIVTMYAGIFQKTGKNSIVYTCEKNAKIFLFNGNGFFEKELTTKDNTPVPSVIKNSNNEYFYSRKGLQYTNSGVFMDNKNIFVFSMASTFIDKIIIDQYSLETMKYIQSFKLDYNNFNSNDIANVIIDNKKVIIRFEQGYASFKFSRYY